MTQDESADRNREIKKKAYELYEQHGFKDGNDFVDWLEAERQAGQSLRSKRRTQKHGILMALVGMLFVVVAILAFMLLRHGPKIYLSQRNLPDMKVLMLVLDREPDEAVVAFGDTHFDVNQSALSEDAKRLLDREVSVLKENPKMRVRMAGYTSAAGAAEYNMGLSQRRANAVRDYLIEKGVAQARITTVGYGQTRPALFEVTPGDIDSKEARANMRVLFEIVVK
jgi:outer membrane protein OmpA-like peptidoglycan-associated protein